jgi:hypothetical protein
VLTDTNLKEDHPRIISEKFGWDWNDELFNIILWDFYELWTFVYFDRLCKLEKRGDEIKKKSSPHLRIISAKFGWDWHSSFRGEDFFLISSPLFSNMHNRSK